MGWRKWHKYNKAKKTLEIKEPTIWDHILSYEKSFIYIMSSEANKGLLKIGKTERILEERAKELSQSTSLPFPFRIVLVPSLLQSYRHQSSFITPSKPFRSSISLAFCCSGVIFFTHLAALPFFDATCLDRVLFIAQVTSTDV
jgi:hypothetical protein